MSHHAAITGPSVFLTRLTPVDFNRFHAARLLYSGSTGPLNPKWYPKTGPCIATFLSELPAALIALKWHRVSLDYTNGKLFVRKIERKNKKENS